MNRRSFFGGLLAAACASALKFYPAPRKPECVVPSFPPPAERKRMITGVSVGSFWGETQLKIRQRDGTVLAIFDMGPYEHIHHTLARPIEDQPLVFDATGSGLVHVSGSVHYTYD